MIRTTGAEYKRFYNDDEAWPADTWYEDESMEVNGENWDDREVVEIPDDAIVKLSGGIVLGHPGGTEPTLETHFRRWKKLQTTATFVVECDLAKVENVKAAIKAAGGKVKGGAE